jgi:hypothetical protein
LGSNTVVTSGNITGNYFIGNGSQLTGITASANTGNVTFNDQAVVGTGNPEGGGGLYLAPGTESVGNLQYIRVRGGDVATHIHLDTGNNAYFDQYFGDDSKYVKLEAGATGNIMIGTNAINWNFDASGDLTVPGNLVINGLTNVFGSNVALLQSNPDLPLLSVSSGSNGGVSSLWVEDVANIGTSNIAAVYVNPTPGSKIVRIAVGQNGSPGPYLWDFSTTGTLTTPGNITLPNGAVIRDTAGDAVAFGSGAGETTQGTYAVAVGTQAGSATQGAGAVAVGLQAGQNGQGGGAVAIGAGAGLIDQNGSAVAIGYAAGETTQGVHAVAIGTSAGRTLQGNYSIILNATGANLNATTANTFTVAPVRNDVSNVAQVMFYNTTSKEITYGNVISVAGNINASQFNFANGVNILSTVAGTYGNANVTSYFQSLTSLALGSGAGATAQGLGSVALGLNAGNDQGYYAVAIGIGSGRVAQSDSAVAIGGEAGWVSQGINSVAVGYRAGTTNQANSSIILNATGANLNATTANTFTVAPVRNDVSTANVAQVMFYNTTSKEITYGNTISIAGNITGNTGGFAIGYRDIPQVVFTSNATLALTDAGKHYFSSNSANVITVPNNATVSFNIGTAISIVQQGTANLTVTPGSGVTMYLAGNSTSASRTLGNFGMATLIKVGTDTWFINGTGVN